MAVVIPLNNFLGPEDDTVTAQTYYRIQNTGGNDRNETVAKPPKRRFRRRATPVKRGIGPGSWPTEVGGPAGRLRAAWRAHGVKMAITGI